MVPSKVYGVMAAGRPCISVGALDGEVARLVDRGGFGAIVAAGDAAALAGAILRMAGSRPEREVMGRAARDLFEAEFQMPLAALKWRSLLQSTMAPQGGVGDLQHAD